MPRWRARPWLAPLLPPMAQPSRLRLGPLARAGGQRAPVALARAWLPPGWPPSWREPPQRWVSPLQALRERAPPGPPQPRPVRPRPCSHPRLPWSRRSSVRLRRGVPPRPPRPMEPPQPLRLRGRPRRRAPSAARSAAPWPKARPPRAGRRRPSPPPWQLPRRCPRAAVKAAPPGPRRVPPRLRAWQGPRACRPWARPAPSPRWRHRRKPDRLPHALGLAAVEHRSAPARVVTAARARWCW